MDIGIVSMRYAKALLEYAKSIGAEAEDALYKEFRMLDRSFRRHPDLRMALENPILTAHEKFTLICTAAVGEAPAGREFTRFIGLVLKNRRESFLQYICLSFLDLYRKDKHIGVGKLITAVPVSQEVCGRIHDSASALLHASMELQTEVDSSIEGGFIFDINDFRLDASIAMQLKKVKRQFIDKNRRIV
ncbi:F0F1 ATP synthase subunit delta [uncultured Bacteroides sp.]|uniref:F0F1 ATP synthase subunit delta n=1 Tax=uncultured Bacteroides sp. TaxID=162156 RepID=UPI00260A62BA|nr:F0F1 ATP synthase subunit delta [uncultured Bacteroides sp.]